MSNKKNLKALSEPLIELMKIVIPDSPDLEKKHLVALKKKFRALKQLVQSAANLSEADLLNQIKVIALGATHYNQEINEIAAKAEKKLREKLSLENQKKLGNLKEQHNKKKKEVSENMVLTSNIFSHLKTEDLEKLIGSTNKEFAYRALLSLFSRNDVASRDLQKRLLSRIFLFPRENILTTLKHWNLEKYQKLTVSILNQLDHLPVHDDFEWEIFTRIFGQDNLLNDKEFYAFFDNSIQEVSKNLPLLEVDQVNILFEECIRSIKTHISAFTTNDTSQNHIYKMLYQLSFSLLSFKQCMKLMILLTGHPAYLSGQFVEAKKETYFLLFQSLIKRLDCQKDEKNSNDIQSKTDKKSLSPHTPHALIPTFRKIEVIFSRLSYKEKIQFIALVFSQPEIIYTESAFLFNFLCLMSKDFIINLRKERLSPFFNLIFKALSSQNLRVCQFAITITAEISLLLPKKNNQKFFKKIIDKLNHTDIVIKLLSEDFIEKCCKQFSLKTYEKLIISNLNSIKNSRFDIYSSEMNNLKKSFLHASQEQKEYFILFIFSPPALDFSINPEMFAFLCYDIIDFILTLPEAKFTTIISATLDKIASKVSVDATHYNQEINEIAAKAEKQLREKLSLENQKKLDNLKEQHNKKKKEVSQNMVLTSNIFSHLKTEDLKKLIASTNKEFAYRALLTLFSRDDVASRDLQKGFLSCIFLFPRENILTILKKWDLKKYQKLTVSILNQLGHLPVHDDFEWKIFTRIFGQDNLLNDKAFYALFDNSIQEVSKYLPLLEVDQVNILFKECIRSIKAHMSAFTTNDLSQNHIYKILYQLSFSLLSFQQCMKLMILLTEHPAYLSGQFVEAKKETYFLLFQSLIKRLDCQKKEGGSNDIQSKIDEKSFPLNAPRALIPTFRQIGVIFSRLSYKEKIQFIALVFSQPEIIDTKSLFLFHCLCLISKDFIINLSKEKLTPFFNLIFKALSSQNLEVCQYAITITAEISLLLPKKNNQKFFKKIIDKLNHTDRFIKFFSEDFIEKCHEQFSLETSEKLIALSLNLIKNRDSYFSYSSLSDFILSASSVTQEQKERFIFFIFSLFDVYMNRDESPSISLDYEIKSFISTLSKEKFNIIVTPILASVGSKNTWLNIMATYIIGKKSTWLSQENHQQLFEKMFTLETDKDSKARAFGYQTTSQLFSKFSMKQKKEFISFIVNKLKTAEKTEKNAFSHLFLFKIQKIMTDFLEKTPEEQIENFIEPILNMCNTDHIKLRYVGLALAKMIDLKLPERLPKQVYALIALSDYKEKRLLEPKYRTKFASAFDFFNSRSKSSKIDAVDQISDQILKGDFDAHNLPSAARNGELKLIVQKFK